MKKIMKEPKIVIKKEKINNFEKMVGKIKKKWLENKWNIERAIKKLKLKRKKNHFKMR